MVDPDQEDLFLADFLSESLCQWRLEGDERVGQGRIIFCEDGSASMRGSDHHGEPDQRRAVALIRCLLEHADGQEGGVSLNVFSSIHNGWQSDLSVPGNWNSSRIFEAAVLFFGGGPLRGDQRVPTPQGWTTVDGIRVGHELYGPDGCLTRVIGVYPQQEVAVFKVSLSDGAQVVCDATHLWRVKDLTGRWKNVSLIEMVVRGLRYRSQYRYQVPVTAALEAPDVDLPLDPYLLGYLIGNGGFTHSSPGVTPTPNDEMPWMCCLPVGVRATQVEKRPGFAPSYLLTAGPRGCGRVNPITLALRDLELWGHRAVGKFIPPLYMQGSIGQRTAMLEGLCDSDGHVDHPGRVEYGTVSPQLADDVVQLSRSLGHLAKSRAEPPRRANEQTFYKVSIRVAPGGAAPFRLSRKRQQWGSRIRFAHSIISAERMEPAIGICLVVDRPDGLFLTDGYVVTLDSCGGK